VIIDNNPINRKTNELETQPARLPIKDDSSSVFGRATGSMAITTDSNGEYFAEIRYYPWGTER
jgi:hypothetical protein